MGPFASNLFLPAMPAMADGLATSLSAIQLALGALFLAYAPAQLVASLVAAWQPACPALAFPIAMALGAGAALAAYRTT